MTGKSDDSTGEGGIGPFLRAALEQTHDGILLVDMQGKILFANASWARMHGIGAEQQVGQKLHAFHDPALMEERVMPVLRQVKETGSYQSEISHDRKDGTPFRAEVKGELIRDDAGESIGVLVVACDITVQKLAEEALQQSEAHFQSLLENAKGFALLRMVVDPEAEINARPALLSPSILDLLGLDDESGFVPALQNIHPQDLPGLLEANARLVQTGAPANHVVRYHHPHKGLRWIQVMASAVFDTAGKPAYYNGFMLDVTEQRQAQEALRINEAHYRSLLESAEGFGIVRFAVDPEHTMGARIVFASPSLADIMGIDDATDLMSWVKNVHPDDVARIVEANRRSWAIGSVFSQIIRFRHPERGMVWVQAIATMVPDERGRPAFFNGVMLDVTAQKQAELAFQESQERYAKLFQHSSDAIFIHDLDGAILDANQRITEWLGYSREEFLRLKVSDLHPEGVPEDPGWLFEALEKDGIARFEAEILRKDGTVFHADISANLIDLSGEKVVLGIARDISERKRIEAQMLAAQRMESVGRLAGGIAHDFNNLLSAITGYSDIILHDLHDEDPMCADVEEISMAARRAAGLTNQLLAFSRRQVLEPKVINLNMLLQNIEKMLRRLIGEDIELIVEPTSQLGSVKADPAQVEQIIMNLVVNARDAMPDGGKLLIETADIDLDEAYASEHIEAMCGSFVMLAVTDTGAGMDEPTRSRLFEPFFTTKRAGEGTGLGLSTVYGIVKQSGGFIWVYSTEEQGTTFKVYLPRVEDEIDEIEEPEVIDLRGTETILVVEDEDVLRRLIGRMLKMNGYEVIEAGQGGEALLLCERHEGEIDLLLTDVVMPQMSGRELAGRLCEQRPGLKVLYMSGYTDNAIVHHGVLDDGVSFLQKPFASTTLARKVRTVLDRS